MLGYIFVLVRAFLSPNDPDTASCAHFLPCLPNPRTSPDCTGRAGPTCGYQPGHSVLITLSNRFLSGEARCPGQILLLMQSVAVYCPVRCATQNLSIQRIWWVDTCASQRNTCDEPCHIGDVGAYASICSRRNSLEVPQQGARPEK